MKDKAFIFLAGMHRSGTSLLHEIMRKHPAITGFAGTGAPEDEGQHLQTVYPPASVFGGPGKFAFDDRSYMDESHPLATPENAERICVQWRDHVDMNCGSVIEKSPPNIIRTRFFQKLFPNSKFVVILRHPLAVSYATKKWSRTSVRSLLDHTFRAYETVMEDKSHLDSVYFLRYEDFIASPQETVDDIFNYLGMDTVEVTHEVRTGINDKYFTMWEKDRNNLLKRLFRRIPPEYEQRANRFGYSIDDCHNLVPVSWLGAHTRSAS